MVSEIIWGKWYKPRIRIIVHILFWLLVTILYYLTLKRLAGDYVKFLVIKELLVTGSLFYSVNWIISKWVSKGRIGPLIIFFVFAYFWWLFWTYFAWDLLEDIVPSSDVRVNRYMHFWLDNGYLGLFAFEKFPVFILDFLLLVSVPLTPKMIKVIVEDSNKLVALERDNLAMELEMLKSQISPHFLFNTLNSIYRMSETGDLKTSESIMRLSNMLRYLLYQTNDEKILLSKELEFLQDYLNLAKLRFGNTTKVELELENIDEPYKILPLILIPFVENAIKHGPERSRNDSWIKVSLKLIDNKLDFVVSNSVNTNSEKPIPGGIGLKNVSRRLDLRYLNNYTLDIEDVGNFYSIHLIIKL
ncbi:sensor histidine kinase [Sphingobacterium sp. WOUb80]|uniref:sensor histidine kinase n=1 Tax=Sphingobacterium sp. WOUb80 TaxID=3234028 RepID=UPI003CE9FA6E